MNDSPRIDDRRDHRAAETRARDAARANPTLAPSPPAEATKRFAAMMRGQALAGEKPAGASAGERTGATAFLSETGDPLHEQPAPLPLSARTAVSRIRPPGSPQTANPTTDGNEKTPAERPLAGLGAYDVDANVLSDPMKPADAASQARTAKALAPILPIARRRNGVEAPNDTDRAKSLEADDAAALAASPASAQAANLAPVAQPAAQQSIVPPAVVQQMVEFAAVHRGRDGVVEFRLGMNRDVLGGVRLQLLSYGRKRMGIRVLRDDAGALNDADLAALVQTLRSKGIDVIEASLGA